ncbi:MAG: DUF6516 family protein [Candidatus Nanohalobium sp.]
MAELIIQKERKRDDLRIIVEAWKIRESDEFPHGIKYSYQAYRIGDGETLLRYDNHNIHAGSRDHKHVEGEAEKLGLTPKNSEGLQKLFRRFMDELDEIR